MEQSGIYIRILNNNFFWDIFAVRYWRHFTVILWIATSHFMKYYVLKPFYCFKTLHLCYIVSGIQKRTTSLRGYCSRNLVPESAISSAQHRQLEAEELQSPWSFHLLGIFQCRRESSLCRCHSVEFQPKPRHSCRPLQRHARLQHIQYNRMGKSQLQVQ